MKFSTHHTSRISFLNILISALLPFKVDLGKEDKKEIQIFNGEKRWVIIMQSKA